MKKILFISVLAIAIALTTGPVFAAGTPVLIGHLSNSAPIQAGTNPRCDINLSKNVSFVYIPDQTGNGVAQSYAIGARHDAGNKAYATASDTTLIYWKTKTSGDISAGDLNTASDSSFQTGWTPM